MLQEKNFAARKHVSQFSYREHNVDLFLALLIINLQSVQIRLDS